MIPDSPITHTQIQLIYRRLDKDNDGNIDLEELSTWWVGGSVVGGWVGAWVLVRAGVRGSRLHAPPTRMRYAQVVRDGKSHGKTRGRDREE